MLRLPGGDALSTQRLFLDQAIKKIGNRYLTAMLIAKRIRQLHHGAAPRVPRQEGESLFSVAVREIAEGKLTLVASPTEGLPPAKNGTAQVEASPAGPPPPGTPPQDA